MKMALKGRYLTGRANFSDDAINGTTTYKDTLLKIKTKWPKDNTGPIE